MGLYKFKEIMLVLCYVMSQNMNVRKSFRMDIKISVESVDVTEVQFFPVAIMCCLYACVYVSKSILVGLPRGYRSFSEFGVYERGEI